MRPKGFAGLRCPKCGEAEGVAVLVENLNLHCTECAEGISRAEILAMIDKWQALLAWLDSAQPWNSARVVPVSSPTPSPSCPAEAAGDDESLAPLAS